MEENCTMEANGLKVIELGSIADSFNGVGEEKLDSLLQGNFVEKGYVVVWLDYKVLIGTCEKGRFHFYENEEFEHKYIHRLRIFDQQKELLIWRSNGEWKGRQRKDDLSGTGSNVVVAQQVLFGTTAKFLDDKFSEISEKRGTKLILPFTNLTIDEKQNRIRIKTHNYVTFNAVHQATYFDCRFVAFTDGERELS